jgi:hypothetical protein
LRDYIGGCFAKLLSDDEFLDAVAMHLLPDEGSQARARIISQRLQALSN